MVILIDFIKNRFFSLFLKSNIDSCNRNIILFEKDLRKSVKQINLQKGKNRFKQKSIKMRFDKTSF